MANINPIKIFQKDNVKEEYYVFSGYVSIDKIEELFLAFARKVFG